MKKFLSLVLALVMTMSLVTVSAGAKDFTDDSKINYGEAVDVISALKVVDGYTDGSFNPSNTLTRGAAAKIICNLILGPTTAAELHADTAPFKDVATNHTFAGYIAFCAQQGIISGYADGTFRPAGTLTTYAFMKMLLGALGYDADVEGYVGSNWSIQVAKRALNIGLDDGLVGDFNGLKAVTREEAALYAFNTLTADMVQYDSKTSVSIGGAEVVIAGSKAQTIRYDAKSYKNDKKDDTLQFCEKYFSKLTLKADEKTDAFGRPSNVWYLKNDKIGTYAKEADATYTADVKSKTIYSDLDLNKAYDYEVIVDGVDKDITFDVAKKDDTKLSATKAGVIGNGSLIEVFEDEQKITVVNTYLMQAADDYNEKKETLTLTTVSDCDNMTKTPIVKDMTLDGDDFAIKDYKEDDYVLVTIADGKIQTIAPAEPVTGTIEEYVHKESITASGETYKYAASNSKADGTETYDLKSDAKIYLDPNGYALFVDAVEGDAQYVYVSEFSKHSTASKGALNAYGYFADGTEGEITVTKIGGDKVYGKDEGTYDAKLGWYTYTEKDGKYELKAVGTQNSDGGTKVITAGKTVDYSEMHTKIVVDGKKVNPVALGTKDTIFVVVDTKDNVRVYTGIKNVPDITTAAGSVVNVYEKTKGYATIVFIDLADGSSISGGNVSGDKVFFLDLQKEGTDADDDNYYRYKALVNGEEKTVRVDVETGANKLAGKLYTDVEYTSKTYITEYTEVSDKLADKRDDLMKDTVKKVDASQKGNTLYLGEGTDLKDLNFFMADSYTIFVVDGTEYETYSMKQVANYNVVKDGATVYGVMNADGEYTALYIVNK